MKLISISCIADEEDIIETFVRVNATFIDTFFFVDDSTDGTGLILDALKNEGFDIHRLFRNRSEPYVQEYAVYCAIQYVIKNKFAFDHLFILDSDEFPKFESRSHANNVMASVPDGCISIINGRLMFRCRSDSLKQKRTYCKISFVDGRQREQRSTKL